MKKKITISLKAFILIGIVFLLLTCRINYVPSESMENTIHEKSFVFSTQIPYLFNKPQRGDIVIFKSKILNQNCVKRIVGMPGECIEIKNGKVYVDGKFLKENYINDWSLDNDGYIFLIPDKHYLVLGDNRDNSEDSRHFETIARELKTKLKDDELKMFAYVSENDIKRKVVLY